MKHTVSCAMSGCGRETSLGNPLCLDHRIKRCRVPGCQEDTPTFLCEWHTKVVKASRSHSRAEYDRKKPGGDLYKTNRWMKMRAIIKSKSVLCAANQLANKPVAASDLDHIVKHEGNLALFFDPNNLQYLSRKAHNEKTGLENRGIICDYVNNTQFDNGRYRSINPYLPHDQVRLEQLIIRKDRLNGKAPQDH